MKKYQNLKDRILAHVYHEVDDGCWIWTGKHNRSNGYPCLTARVPGRRSPVNLYVHRLSPHILGDRARPVGPQYHVDHWCRNPSCVNPAHLRVVMPKTNLERRRLPREVV
jgi:hypothetical protein